MANKYMHRDIHWVSVFEREVLDEAEKKRPLAERVLFYGIAAGNLKEFMQVRYVIGLRESDSNESENLKKAIGKFYDGLVKSWMKFNDRRGIVRSVAELKKSDGKWITKTFKTEVFPTLQPITFDRQKQLYLHPGTYVFVATKKKEQTIYNYIELPEGLDRYIPVPGKHFVVDTLDLIQDNLSYLFKDRKVEMAFPFTISRSAEVYEQVDETEDPLTLIKRTLHDRERAWITMIQVGSTEKRAVNFLKKVLPLEKNTIIFASKCIGLSDLKRMPNCIYADKDQMTKFKPVNTFPKASIFDYINKKDRLAFHPYESYDTSMVRFLEEAADDPKTISIKISLYRVSDNSKIINALLKAADHGKAVTVLVELKARFDEHHNVEVATALREGGVRIAFTSPNMKTHAKVCIITRKEKGGLRTYCQVGTGNYSESNSKQYTDYSYFTADPDLGFDLTRFFDLLTSDQGEFKSRKVIYAPYNMRSELSELIDGEIKKAKKGKKARIICKCNAFTDDKMADKFVEAAKAGVDITMIIRGSCILRPNKHIKIYSIVGQFLEHSRVYLFGYGDNSSLMLGSADLMHRNLSLRHELLILVEPKDIKARIERHLKWYLEDNTNRRIYLDDYKYEKVKADKKEKEFSSQDRCIKEAKELALN